MALHCGTTRVLCVHVLDVFRPSLSTAAACSLTHCVHCRRRRHRRCGGGGGCHFSQTAFPDEYDYVPDDVALHFRKSYYAAVSQVDHNVGIVLDELDALGE